MLKMSRLISFNHSFTSRKLFSHQKIDTFYFIIIHHSLQETRGLEHALCLVFDKIDKLCLSKNISHLPAYTWKDDFSVKTYIQLRQAFVVPK